MFDQSLDLYKLDAQIKIRPPKFLKVCNLLIIWLSNVKIKVKLIRKCTGSSKDKFYLVSNIPSGMKFIYITLGSTKIRMFVANLT